jgi:hypothetical protein
VQGLLLESMGQSSSVLHDCALLEMHAQTQHHMSVKHFRFTGLCPDGPKHCTQHRTLRCLQTACKFLLPCMNKISNIARSRQSRRVAGHCSQKFRTPSALQHYDVPQKGELMPSPVQQVSHILQSVVRPQPSIHQQQRFLQQPAFQLNSWITSAWPQMQMQA